MQTLIFKKKILWLDRYLKIILHESLPFYIKGVFQLNYQCTYSHLDYSKELLRLHKRNFFNYFTKKETINISFKYDEIIFCL